MRQVWLDYVKSPPGYGWPGWMLLGVGIVVAVLLLVFKAWLDERVEVSDYEVSRLQRRIDSLQVFARSERKSADAGQHLKGEGWVIWEKRLNDFEAAAVDDVTLLALLPDKSGVVINAEAKMLATAMDYVERLQHAGSLDKVRLTEHSIAKDHPQRPVRFILTARWSEKSVP